jgi:bisphosphoglycerate-dependent phosphoglycerate mutase
MDKKIVLARHGETIFNRDGFIMGRSDSPLTPEGISAAKQVARLIEEQKIRTVFCSPLGRARMSTDIYTERIGLPILIRGYGGTFMWRVGGKPRSEVRDGVQLDSKDLAGQASRRKAIQMGKRGLRRSSKRSRQKTFITLFWWSVMPV